MATLYTIGQLDAAIAAVLGKRAYDALNSGHVGRVTMHDMAIKEAFMQSLDNEDTDILRQAANDLKRVGMYQPFVLGEE